MFVLHTATFFLGPTAAVIFAQSLRDGQPPFVQRCEGVSRYILLITKEAILATSYMLYASWQKEITFLISHFENCNECT